MRRVLFLLLALSLVGVQPATAAARTTLTIKADLADGAKPYSWTLTCDPVGGKHPNRKAACALLAKEGTKVFTPVPAGSVCTQQYGGPERVKVTGSVRGKKINALFIRTNGCQISRYDRAAALFTIPGTTVVRGNVTLDEQLIDTSVIFMSGNRQVITRSVAGEFALRLTQGQWVGSADAGARSCTPVNIVLPNAELFPLTIACRSLSS
jgi:hypothetical protein